MKGHNFDRGCGDICKKCGKVHVHGRRGDFRTMEERFGQEKTKEIKEKWKVSRKGRVSWSEGLTKETDSRIARGSKKRSKKMKQPGFVNSSWWVKGHKPWNKDLTKETDERVAKYAEKLIGHEPANPNAFNEWREKNNIIVTYPPMRYIEALGHGVRSTWEEWFALRLKEENIPYTYEDTTFVFFAYGIKRRYTPDFKVKDVTVEIKSFIRPNKIKIINAFLEQHQNINYLIVGLDNGKSNYKLQCKIIPWSERECVIEMLKNI